MAQSDFLSLDGEHRVLTPEYVEFSYALAGRTSRFLALSIDTVVTTGLTMLVGAVAVALSAAEAAVTRDFGFGATLFFIAQFLIDWGYMLFFEMWWNGQTLGKRALGLRVIQESGVRVGLYQSLLRNLVRPLDKLPLFYLVGGTSTLLTRSQQRLGDVLAGTIVVQEPRLRIPSAFASHAELGALTHDGEFMTRVSKLSQAEETVIFSAAFRREELALKARLSLFSTLSEHLQSDLNFVKPAHLSDEKLVLSVAAALVARRQRKTTLGKRLTAKR